MAIPDYFRRNAVAIAQTLSGLDEKLLREVLNGVCIGVTFDSNTIGLEGDAILDLIIRLLARLYPAISIHDVSHSALESEVTQLATRVNPNIDLSLTPSLEVVIGLTEKKRNCLRTVFTGSDNWTANLSSSHPQTCGDTKNPFGAGLAACLTAGILFRYVFLNEVEPINDLTLSIPRPSGTIPYQANGEVDIGQVVLAGAGAIGNAAAWALSRAKICGSIDIVDPETIDLGNLQRYALAERADENEPKAEFLAQKFSGALNAKPHSCNLAKFLELKAHKTETLLLALDSATDRCVAQASLPRYVINAWTQPNDLGISVHNFLKGACVNCLYLPNDKHSNEDAIIADAFGIPDQVMEVRTLLHANEGTPLELLKKIAHARQIEIEKLLPFEGRKLRDLYLEGFCGGGVISLKNIPSPTSDVHVPLSHQSALAGILLAAATVDRYPHDSERSTITQYNVLKMQDRFQVYPVAKDKRDRCICQDLDYIHAYKTKYDFKNSQENPTSRVLSRSIST